MSKIDVIECFSDSVSLTSCDLKKKQSVLNFYDSIKITNIIQDEQKWLDEVVSAIRQLASSSSKKLNFFPHIILPSEVLHFKTISIPKVKNCKQDSVTRSHIELTIPGSANYCYNYILLEATNSEHAVFVTLAKKDWIVTFCDALAHHHIYPLSLESKPPLLITSAQQDPNFCEPTILIHLEPNSALCLFISGNSYWVRSIDIHKEFSIKKIEEAITYYSNKIPEFKPKQIIFSNANPNVVTIRNEIQKRIPIPQISITSRFGGPGVSTSSSGLILNTIHKINLSINLRPPKIQFRTDYNLLKSRIVASFTILIISFILFTYFFISKKESYFLEAQHLQSILGTLQTNQKKIELKQCEIRVLQNALNNFEKILNNQNSWMAFLNHLQKCCQSNQGAIIESLCVMQDHDTQSLDDELGSFAALKSGSQQSKILQLEGYCISAVQNTSIQSHDRIRLLLNQICLFQSIDKVIDYSLDESDVQKFKFKFTFKLINSKENS